MKKIYPILIILCLSVCGLQLSECYGQPTIKPVVTHASCNGGADGKIRLEVTGTAPFRFEWSNGQVTQEITELNAGMYKVKVTDARGSTQVTEMQVQNRSSLTLKEKQLIIPQEGTNNGVVEVSVQGGQAPYTFSLSKYSNKDGIQRMKQANGLFKGLSKGKYLVDAVDARGCMATLNISLK